MIKEIIIILKDIEENKNQIVMSSVEARIILR